MVLRQPEAATQPSPVLRDGSFPIPPMAVQTEIARAKKTANAKAYAGRPVLTCSPKTRLNS